MRKELRAITVTAMAHYVASEEIEMTARDKERGESIYRNYWEKNAQTTSAFNWCKEDYDAPGFQYKFVKKWFGEESKDRILEWFDFFTKAYCDGSDIVVGSPLNDRRELNLYLFGAGPGAEIFAFLFLLAKFDLCEGRRIQICAYDFAAWGGTVAKLAQAFSQSSPLFAQLLCSSSVSVLYNDVKLTRARTSADSDHLQSPIVSDDITFSLSDGESFDMINCITAKNAVLNKLQAGNRCTGKTVVTISHLMSHCEDPRAYIDQILAIAKNTNMHLFLSEERPQFHGVENSSEESFYRLEEGFKNANKFAKNYYFWLVSVAGSDNVALVEHLSARIALPAVRLTKSEIRAKKRKNLIDTNYCDVRQNPLYRKAESVCA